MELIFNPITLGLVFYIWWKRREARRINEAIVRSGLLDSPMLHNEVRRLIIKGVRDV